MQSISDAMGWVLLFCPGDRPERFAKAAQAANIAVLDLEDGVAAAQKDVARVSVTVHISAKGADGYAVRINLPMTERGRADAEAVANAGVRPSDSPLHTPARRDSRPRPSRAPGREASGSARW